MRENLHKIALEEFFQLPLGCRVGEVADVETAALGGTGLDGILGIILASEGGIAQSIGNVVDSSVRNLLRSRGHFIETVGGGHGRLKLRLG